MRRGEVQDNLYCLQELRVRFKNTVNRYFISSLSLSHVLSQILYELRIARQKNEYNYQIHSFSLCQGLHRRLPRCTSGGLEMEGCGCWDGDTLLTCSQSRGKRFFSGLAKCELSQHCPHCPHVSSRVTCPVSHPRGVHVGPLAHAHHVPVLLPLAGAQVRVVPGPGQPQHHGLAPGVAGAGPQQAAGVGQGLAPADVLQTLQNLEVHRLGPGHGARLQPPLVEVLPELAGPGEGLLLLVLLRLAVVAVEEMLLVGQVAELVGGAHLELVVLQRRQQQRRVLQAAPDQPR